MLFLLYINDISNAVDHTSVCRHLHDTSVPLLLQDKQTELVKSAKYLSIYLDCKLSWSKHIKELCMKLSIFHHISSFISPTHLPALVMGLNYTRKCEEES